jgi:predicted permease
MPEWKRLIAARLASLRLRPERERDIVDELSQHLDERYRELRADGVTEDEAVRLAIDEIDEGDLLAREMRTLKQARAPQPIPAGLPQRRLFGDVWQDLGYAARILRKNAGFSAAVIVTLALGIGANTAIFSLVNATLLQRLPVEDRDRLYQVRDARGSDPALSYPAYTRVRDGVTLADSLVAWANIAVGLNADGDTDLVFGAIVSGHYFTTLGVRAAHGRLLGITDDVTPGSHPVMAISDRLWRGRFGGRADIVGLDVRLNGQPFTIVGVAPAGFPGAELGVWHDIYVPMMMQAWTRPPRGGYSGEMNPDLLQNPNGGWLSMFARLKPGVSREQAQAELEALVVATRPPGAPPPDRQGRFVSLVPVDDGDPRVRRQLSSVAWLLAAVVGAVLLIACANVANLLLSKAAARRREVAVRLALGASRLRIVRQLLTESLLLALLGGAVGVALAFMLMQLFHLMPPPAGALPIALAPSLDRTVLAFSLGLSMITGVMFGVAPAWQTSRPDLVPALKDETSVVDRRGRRVNLKQGLVVVEVALAVVLLIGAGLFVRSLRAIRAIDPGMAAAELVSAPININLLRYTKAQGQALYRQLIERLEQVPGVSSASVARVTLLAGGGRVTGVLVEGRPLPADLPPGAWAMGRTAAFANVVGPGYFDTVGVPLVGGRDFHDGDLEDHPMVAIVNETFARQFFPNENPIGKRFNSGSRNAAGAWTEIVGIARDSKYSSLSEAPRPMVYMPLSQRHESGTTLYVRSSVPASTLIPLIRREIQQLEPNLPLPDVQTVDQAIRTQLYPQRMGANLLAGFGGLALVLASLGVYGVLAFSISRRRHELGIRMAIGADRRSIFGLVLREGLLLVGIGLTIGLIAAANLTHLLANFLFGVGALDAVTFAMVPAILVLVALVACWLPARRATRVDPVVALRNG